ncbi:MAG: di-trans,poly-cis-decaprenylcistransferase [Bacilli bacterium]|nr:di-trans,poly-cis-decaprenylcistransferase [Bacilli bacterium]
MNEVKVPNHVAIIMDGNRRWAKEKGLITLKGHQAGFENLKELSKYIFNKGTKYLSVFAFSTENFKRSEEEVKYLMDMVVTEIPKLIKEFNKNNIKVMFSGRRDRLRNDVLKVIDDCANQTLDNNAGILNICLNYGGQQEIVDACKKIANLVKEDKLDLDKINEESFYNYLYNELPAIDLMIRTSGEYRISNFLIYQLAYAEMYFTNVYFPDFNAACYDEALASFNKRDRRFGGSNETKNN